MLASTIMARNGALSESPAQDEAVRPAANPRDSWLRPLLLLLALLILAKLLLMTAYALDGRYVMDEYGQAERSRFIGEFYDGFQPVKTVLYTYYFGIAAALADGAEEWMRGARMLGLLLALGMTGLVYALVRRRGRAIHEGLFAVFVALATSNFLERAFRIRSDTLATFLTLLALWLAVAGRQGDDAGLDDGEPSGLSWRSLLRPLAVGLLIGGAFLSTQKAVYATVAFGLGYLAAGRGWERLRQAAAYSTGWAVAVLAYAVAFGGGEFPAVLHQVFLAPRELALHGADVYGNLRAYVSQTLERNTLTWGLGFAGLAVAAAGWGRLPSRDRLLVTVSAVLALLIFLHNQPWPYVFVLAAPLVALWSPETVRWLARPERRTAACLGFVVLLSLSFAHDLRILERTNRQQEAVMSRAEAFLGPQDAYVDGIGMVPSRPRAGVRWWWDAQTLATIRERARQGDFQALEDLFRDHPKLWIHTYRLDGLWPLVDDAVEHSYVKVDANLWLSGLRLTAGERQRILLIWPGEYGLYDAWGGAVEGTLEVNGEPRSVPLPLAAGWHEVTLAGTEPLFLLPAGLDLPGPLPSRQAPLDLFAGVYD